MATIFRLRGLRVVIYSNDHGPPHVQLVGPDREARIELGGAGKRPSVTLNNGLSRRQLAAALFEINRNRALLPKTGGVPIELTTAAATLGAQKFVVFAPP